MEAKGFPELGPSDALLVIDVQRDFCEGGALPVPDADTVIPILNDWIERVTRSGATVLASRDWHPRGHASFTGRGGRWPEHCVQNSTGAELHPALQLPRDVIVLSKGQELDRDPYSAFDGTGLYVKLKERGIRRVFVGGLALDACVRATVLEALRHGFKTHVLTEASRAVDNFEGEQALREMRANGACIEPSTRAT